MFENLFHAYLYSIGKISSDLIILCVFDSNALAFNYHTEFILREKYRDSLYYLKWGKKSIHNDYILTSTFK